MTCTVSNLTWQPPGAPGPVLDIASLSLSAGSITALIGPSGSGKTSLLHLLSGLRTPSTGSITWESTDLTTLPEARKDHWRRQNLGLVFQDFRLLEELSVLDNALLPLTFAHWRIPVTRKAAVKDHLAAMGLTRLDQRASTLSRGEMQRVAIARALAFGPPVLCADEPTANLDAQAEEDVCTILADLVRLNGITLVVATHSPRLKAMASQVVNLDHGRLVHLPENRP